MGVLSCVTAVILARKNSPNTSVKPGTAAYHQHTAQYVSDPCRNLKSTERFHDHDNTADGGVKNAHANIHAGAEVLIGSLSCIILVVHYSIILKGCKFMIN